VARGNVSGSQFREWETLTHMVAFGSGNQVLASKDSPEIPLAVIGPFTITTKVTAGLEIASCAQADSLGNCNGTTGSPMGPVKRLLGPVTSAGVTNARPSTFAPARAGRWTDGNAVDGSFNDDAWVRNLDNNTIHDNDPAQPNFLMS